MRSIFVPLDTKKENPSTATIMTRWRQRPRSNGLIYTGALVWLSTLYCWPQQLRADSTCCCCSAFAPPQAIMSVVRHHGGASPSLRSSVIDTRKPPFMTPSTSSSTTRAVTNRIAPSPSQRFAKAARLVTFASLSLPVSLFSSSGRSTATTTTALLSSQSTSTDYLEEGGHSTQKNKPRKASSRVVVTLWIHLISIFVVVNSSTRITTPAAAGCWPAVMATRVSLSVWRFLHAVAAMVFAGSIVTTTVVEWNVVRSWYNNSNFHRNNNNNNASSTSRGADSSSPEEWLLRFWFVTASSVEQWLVLPALTLSIVSGVAQAAITYQHLSLAPRYVKSSLHILLLFGLWWGVTDRTTQRTVTLQQL